MTKGHKPVFIVRAKNGEDSNFMTTIGAAWPFKDGEGYVVKLNFMPLDGQMILVPPKEE